MIWSVQGFLFLNTARDPNRHIITDKYLKKNLSSCCSVLPPRHHSEGADPENSQVWCTRWIQPVTQRNTPDAPEYATTHPENTHITHTSQRLIIRFQPTFIIRLRIPTAHLKPLRLVELNGGFLLIKIFPQLAVFHSPIVIHHQLVAIDTAHNVQISGILQALDTQLFEIRQLKERLVVRHECWVWSLQQQRFLFPVLTEELIHSHGWDQTLEEAHRRVEAQRRHWTGGVCLFVFSRHFHVLLFLLLCWSGFFRHLCSTQQITLVLLSSDFSSIQTQLSI